MEELISWQVTHFCVTPFVNREKNQNTSVNWDILFFYVYHQGIYCCGICNKSVSPNTLRKWEADRLVVKLKRPLFLQLGDILYVNSRREVAVKKNTLEKNSSDNLDPIPLGHWDDLCLIK